MKVFWPIVGIFLFVALAGGCAPTARDSLKKEPPGDIEPIVLGSVYSLTGGQAGLDVPSLQGAQLAIGQANNAGGILGRPVQLVVADAASDPQAAEDGAARMLEQNPAVSALFGLSDTDLVRAAAPVAVRHGRLFLTSGATSPKLPGHAPGFIYLACFGDNVQAAAAAEWAIKELRAGTVSILFNAEATYSRLLQGYFRARYEELGGQVLSVAGYSSASGLRGPISSLKKAEIIYLAATPEEVLQAVIALRKAGHSSPILGGDGFDVAGLWEGHPEVKQVFFTTHAFLESHDPAPEVAAFRQAFGRAYRGAVPDAFAALGYDTVRLLLQAVDMAGSSDPEKVRAALGEIRDFEGVTGRIGYLPGIGVPLKSVTLVGADRGALRLVQQKVPERVPPP